jgi:hypothetical protein
MSAGCVGPADLEPSEIRAARHAYALGMARCLSTLEISRRLATDNGIYDRRGKPYRCRRLRRLIAAYQACVDAGVEPEAESIFGGDATGTMAGPDDR